MATRSRVAEPAPWAAIVAVVACLSVFATALGLTYPLLSLLLERRGVGAGWIGLNAAMTPLGIALAAPLAPLLARRAGAWPLAVAAIATTMICLVLLKLFESLTAWCAIRFLMGCANGILFTATEAWIAALAPAALRGRIIGTYASVLSLGFAAGPLLLPVTGIDGWPPFLAGLAALALGAAPLLAARGVLPSLSEGGQGSAFAFAAAAPALLLIVAVVALFDTAAMSLLPIYGLRHGLSEAAAAIAVGVLIIGNVALQPPVGWLADRWSWRTVLGACALLVFVGGLALPAAIDGAWRWPLLFAWGAAAFGAYTVALIELGRRFTGAALVAGAAAFSAAWGMGGLAGPLLAGVAMDLVGPHGLPLFLGLVFLPLAAIAAWKRPATA